MLIDFENVQPKNLELLIEHPFKVFVFVGANQSKVPMELAAAMQALGAESKYIQISGSGPNALDFHIAFYIGELAAKDPDSYFHVISKDTGFEPLIRHLRERKIRIRRESDLGDIPILQNSNATGLDEKIEAIVKKLKGLGHSRPRKVKTLTSTINSLFLKQLTNKELLSLVKVLEDRELIKVNEGNISYKLPQ